MEAERIIALECPHKGFVYIRDQETALKINHDPVRFSPPNMEEYLINLQKQSGLNFTNLILIAKNALFFIQGPRHTLLRKETLKIFGKKNIQLWDIEIERVVEQYLTKITPDTTVNLITTYTHPIFTTVTQKILGIRPENQIKFDFWTQQLQVLLQPLLPTRELLKMEEAFKELITQVKNARVTNTSSVKLPTLMDVFKDITVLDFTEDDAIAAAIVIYGAAINLSQTLTNILWHILHSNETVQNNARNTEWVVANMEYLIKIGASPRYIHAIAQEDGHFNDNKIKKGDNVLLDLLEINNVGCPFSKQNKWDDEEMSQQDHMAFGTGIHFCIGAFLTRKVIEKSIPMLLQQFPKLKTDQLSPKLTSHKQTIIIEEFIVNT